MTKNIVQYYHDILQQLLGKNTQRLTNPVLVYVEMNSLYPAESKTDYERKIDPSQLNDSNYFFFFCLRLWFINLQFTPIHSRFRSLFLWSISFYISIDEH